MQTMRICYNKRRKWGIGCSDGCVQTKHRCFLVRTTGKPDEQIQGTLSIIRAQVLLR